MQGDRGRRVENLSSHSTQARELLPTVQRLGSEVGTTVQQVSDVFVGTGPGSYTGLRVGIATALGLAYATGATLRAVPSFEALAFDSLKPSEEGFIAWNARAQRFYFARYLRTEDDVACLVPPRIVRGSQLRELLKESLPIFGDATVVEAAELNADIAERLREDVFPSAGGVLALGPRREIRSLDEVEPLYLREFGA